MTIRLTLNLPDQPEQWLDMQDVWTRRMMRQWDASLPDFPANSTDEEQAELIRQSDLRILELLSQWSEGCYLRDVKGREYHKVSELTPEGLDDLDWPVLQFLYQAPIKARLERAVLGEVKSVRS